MSRALIAVALVTTGCRSSGGAPSFTEGAPVRNYDVTYEVNDGGRTSTERLVVNRPFASYLVLEGGERITALGRLATRSSDGPWTVLEIPPAPAGRDLRPDIAVASATRRHLVQRRGVKTITRRRCRVYRTAGPVTTGVLKTTKPTSSRHTDFCVGRGQIVLEQIEVEDGDVMRRVTATAVRTGTAVGTVPPIPAVESLSVQSGGGRARPVDAATRPPFARFYLLGTLPSGFEPIGRYAVVPMGLVGSASLVSDVYARGADLLLVDQGATTSGPPLFDPDRPTSPVDLEDLGQAEAVLDLRANEVRVVLPDGGFLRVVGTLPPDELAGIARQLRLQEVSQ